jgi:hypothetical protein
MQTRILLSLTTILSLSAAAGAATAQEGLAPTQILVTVDSKTPVVPTPDTLKLSLNNKPVPITSFQPLAPNGTQIAILIDDGLRVSVGSQLGDLKKSVANLPPGTEVMIGYMQNGEVKTAQPFTTDLAAASANFRLPFGSPGMSASPYFCLSDFVKRWQGEEAAPERAKARFVLMITNGVDPYNGSTSILNQNSPNVEAAVEDAQRAGVAVYSIYYGDAGFRRGRGSFSGQSYLEQLGQGTGGSSLYMGSMSPVSLAPYLTEFQHDISETYVATFQADAGNGRKPELLRVKVSTSTPKLKLRAPEEVRAGNIE